MAAKRPISDRGHTGAKRPRGKTGATGARGLRGKTGATGPVGHRGKIGLTGPVGPMGPAGAPGADHSKAITTLQGQLANVSQELQTQLTRIAQIQAQLDRVASGSTAGPKRIPEIR
jgi:Collagen triple helix repeat (20 copies)